MPETDRESQTPANATPGQQRERKTLPVRAARLQSEPRSTGRLRGADSTSPDAPAHQHAAHLTTKPVCRKLTSLKELAQRLNNFDAIISGL
ncbi:hypothetical protein COCON_G00204320 [Conger conger]|uniref:Uncharacterized protein n=1 Tax=Conger conger TaxID=82655 RepID=A0A9Q1HN72_CONCO|nr:hypothetical protein COCON_G00204320 [Conger conger]